jgi:uncharacterized membrane protein
MLITSRVLLIIAGLMLIVDAIFMLARMPHPLGWPLHCPISLVVLALGIILFAFGSKAFKN